MYDANTSKALSCVLTVKLPFSHVETVDIMAPFLYMFYKWDTLAPAIKNITDGLQLSQCSL